MAFLSCNEVIPREIMADILFKLPVKSTVRFRCVSKPWLEFITYSNFPHWVLKVNQDCDHKKNCLHNEKSIFVFVNKERALGGSGKLYGLGGGMGEESFNSVVEIDSSLFGGRSFIVKTTSCDGMVCASMGGVEGESLILWNPTTRDNKILVLPTDESGICSGVCGLGLDLSVDDYKVVSVFRKQAFVFSVKRNCWRYVRDIPLFLSGPGVAVNGCLYWAAGKRKSKPNVVVCFDLANERFREMPHPPFDARHKLRVMSLGKSLGVYDESEQTLWEMNVEVANPEAGQEIWTINMILPKIRKFDSRGRPVRDNAEFMPYIRLHKTSCFQLYPLCFTKSGKIVISLEDSVFALYDPTNKKGYKLLQVPGFDNGPFRNTFLYTESIVSPNSIRSMNDID